MSIKDAPPAAAKQPAAAGARLERVAKRYEDTSVLTDLVLEVPERAFMVLVGPSGCGKTTCLRLLAGLESPDAGRVLIGDRDVTRVPSRDRDIAMVFQDFALYPHMTVEANIAFGLRLRARHERGRGPSRREIQERVDDVIRLLELHGLEGRRPAQLSGGQRQRVALARAIVRRPRVFLMDEPLSNLDAQLRAQTRAELVQLHRRLAATVLYVTHDQVEAMSMATTMAVMDKGAILQVGAPGEIYERPATVFVGRFVGSPPMNVHQVSTRADTGATVVEGTGISGVLPSTGSGAVASVGWRPPHGRLHALEAGQERTHPVGGLRLRGRVDTRELLGEEMLIGLSGPWGSAGVLYPTSAPQPAVGDLVTVDVPEDRVHQFAASGRRCT